MGELKKWRDEKWVRIGMDGSIMDRDWETQMLELYP